MRLQQSIIVPVCPFRVETRCGRSVVERMLGAEAGAMPLADLLRAALRLLSMAGVRTAVLETCPRCPMVNGFLCPNIPATPFYDDCRTLFAGHFIVRHYKRAAWNQIEVLKRFQAEQWRWKTEDALGKQRNGKYAGALQDAIHQLNQKHVAPLVRFHYRVIERAATWEWTYERNC